MRRIALSITILALLTGACSQTGADQAPPPKSTASTGTSAGFGVQDCAAGDTTSAVEVRRPSHRQVSVRDWAHVHSQHRVATVVLRNISSRPCYGGSAFDFKILDRVGRTVGDWDSPTWFAGYYQPSGYRTFSLPSVIRCDRPGPFTAIAVVGRYTARRHGLRRSEITCLHVGGKQ
jgi:hypothetical protein